MGDYVNNAKDAIRNSIPSGEDVAEGVKNTSDSVKDTFKSTMDDFSSKSIMNASTEFLQSNSMIAKFMFILLVLIVFMVLLQLGFAFVYYMTQPNTSPFLVSGMLPGNYAQTITQDPASGNPVVYRSNNQNSGVEFTWSFWLMVNSVPPPASTYYPVFVKGTNDYITTGGAQDQGKAQTNNGPGVYLSNGKDTNNDDRLPHSSVVLNFIMDVVTPDNTAGSGGTQYAPFDMSINNIPIGKWIHIAFRLQNKIMDCYINGTITDRLSFGDFIPKQNYGDIMYAGNGGYPGSLSNLRYYDYALSVYEIGSVVYYGPNLNSAMGAASSFTGYLGNLWYTAVSPSANITPSHM